MPADDVFGSAPPLKRVREDEARESSHDEKSGQAVETKAKTALAEYVLHALYGEDRDLRPHQKFVAFLMNKSPQLLEMIKDDTNIGPEEKEELKNFINNFCSATKENQQRSFPISHTPTVLLRLARYFLPIHRAMAAEAVWGAASIRLKQLASAFGYAKFVGSHAELINFCRVVAPINELEKPPFIGRFYEANACHSSGFYENTLDEGVIEDAIENIGKFIVQVNDLQDKDQQGLKRRLEHKYGAPAKGRTQSLT